MKFQLLVVLVLVLVVIYKCTRTLQLIHYTIHYIIYLLLLIFTYLLFRDAARREC